ncbi:MAG: hypothetical protein ACYS8K_07340, partial [Planctomycetota bacterium]
MVRKRMSWRLLCVAVLAAMLMFGASGIFAEEPAEAPPADDGPPLPLHTIEGVGGLVLTPTALLVNPGPPGTVVGKPAVALHLGAIGHKDFEAATFTWTLWRRLELGYAFNRLGLNDFEDDLQGVLPGVNVGT